MKIENPMKRSEKSLTKEISRKTSTTRRPAPKVPLLPSLAVMAVLFIAGIFIGTRLTLGPSISGDSLNFAKLNEVYSALEKNYTGKLDNNKMIDGAATGMVNALGDPYTEFFTADQAKQFNSDLNGTLSGVGIQLGQNDKKQLEVVAPIDGTPAARAGILAGDVIAKIDGKDSISLSTDVAVDKIRGKSGTTVSLTIIRGSETKEFKLTREKISVPSTTWKISNDNGKTWTSNNDDNFANALSAGGEKIGYIRISQFGEDTSSLSTKAAQDFAKNGVKNVVLDLRGNGGGYVDAAQGLVSLWLPYGTEITKEVGKNNAVVGNVTASGGNVLEGVKTVVLIDGGSASASEITAAALRDNGAATLIGEKSYGKGVMQQLVNLSDGAQLKVTIAKWMTPKNKNINHDGIEPDQKVSLTSEQLASGNDTQLSAAVAEFAK